MVMNPRVNVAKGVLAHPTVKVSIASHNDSIVPAFREQLPKSIEALLGSIRFPDCIIASAQKANLHSGESLHVFQNYQVSELGLVHAVSIATVITTSDVSIVVAMKREEKYPGSRSDKSDPLREHKSISWLWISRQNPSRFECRIRSTCAQMC